MSYEWLDELVSKAKPLTTPNLKDFIDRIKKQSKKKPPNKICVENWTEEQQAMWDYAHSPDAPWNKK